MAKVFFLTLCLMILCGAGHSKADLTAHVEGSYGPSWGSGQLHGRLTDGWMARIKLFGGAKLPKIKWLSAAGIGFDFTFSQFKDKNNVRNFSYDRYSWDWLYIPIRFWLFRITPGMSWVITNVRVPDWAIREKSVRPAFQLTLGLGFPIGSFEIFVDARSEYVLEDREKANTGSNMNVTGYFLSTYAGLGVYF
ncbi:MAG: hypothetical protein HOE90_05480 [Bacteriovoracaceae bacterium]|nr:hypothetical protein [Bacteriovoracaceae bacterium]